MPTKGRYILMADSRRSVAEAGLVPGGLSGFLRWLPSGAGLPSSTWRARHRFLVTISWAHLPVLAVVGLTQGIELGHLLIELGLVAGLLVAVQVGSRRAWKAVLTGLALTSCSALLVHYTNGLIESHFHFFVVIPMISLYQDWRPLVAGLAYVVVHHGIVGMVDPESVFNHPAAQARPMLWALVHGGYVLAQTAVIVAYWRFSETLESSLLEEATRRREAEAATHRLEAERLEHVVKAKDQFVASVSHELRTPLAAVVGFAQILRDEQKEMSPDERHELAATIAREASDLAAIVEDLLVAARAEIGAVSFEHVPVDLIANCEQIITVMPEESRARIVLHRPPGEVKATGDPARVRQIIRNLLTNAIRYGGPRIEMSIERSSGRAGLRVCDDGEQIPANLREAIFRPYVSAHSVTTQPESVGLGLSVSRRLAEMMGGRLSYRHDGEWSVFQLELPLHVEAPQPDGAVAAASPN